MALMPPKGSTEIKFTEGGYDLLIIPAREAYEEALYVAQTYVAEPKRDGTPRKLSFGLVVKWYSSREPQVLLCRRWDNYRECWSLIPTPTQLAASGDPRPQGSAEVTAT